jgi:CubicO group peptidase (beta-lactamase class C family)
MINSQLSRMEEIIQSYVDTDQFMGSVLVSYENEIIINKGYGFANLEWNIPNKANTKFRLGSITKQFTAVAILLLDQQGKLKLTDPVQTYIPNTPSAWDNITVFHLLTHTSGIPNYTRFPNFQSLTTLPQTPEQQIAFFRDEPLDFLPGSAYTYNNSGYVLLGDIIELISGHRYENFIREQLLKPLGMNDSGYDSHAKIIPRRASGYIKSTDGLFNADYLDMSIPYAAGSLYSTVEDLLFWQKGLFGEKLLSAEWLKKFTTPFKNNYCMGIVNQSIDGHPVIHHAGGINGFGTILMHCLNDKLIIAVLSNVNAYGYVYQDIAMKILRLIHGKKVILASERKSVSIPKNNLTPYIGNYTMCSTNEAYTIHTQNLVIRLEGNQLVAQIEGKYTVDLFPISESHFFGKVPDVYIEFKQDKKQLTWTQDGEGYIANRV